MKIFLFRWVDTALRWYVLAVLAIIAGVEMERIGTVIDRISEPTSHVQSARMQPWRVFCDLCRWPLHHACTMGAV